MAITEKHIAFDADDGFSLSGTLYVPEDPQCTCLVTSGTGFPRHFYAPISRFLASRGALCLTFDYRGISADGDDAALKGSSIRYFDFGRFDMPGAVAVLKEQAPALPMVHVAHSVGGHFLGLMHNQSLIERHAFVSVGSGFWGKHHKRYVPAEMMFWWGIGSYGLWRHGYLKPMGGWRGTALPPLVFKDWRRWAHRRRYFEPDLERADFPVRYDAVTAPIRSWIFNDDPIATPRSGQDMLDLHPNAQTEMVLREPADFDVSRIGHEGAYRKGREKLWSEIADWLAI